MLAWLERNQLLVLGLAGLLLLAGLAVRSFANSDPPDLLISEAAQVNVDAPVRVHVAGSVNRPGVYELFSGDRVELAIAAAGGPTSEADLNALNLARRLRDGERVFVPRKEGAETAIVSPQGLLDINTATERQLDALPGIGETYSRRIVDSRRVDGPFGSIDELVQRRVLPAATLEQIRGLITAGTP